MKKRIFKWSLFPTIGFLLLGSVAITACDSSANFKSATVRLNKSEIQMNVGDREKITATVSKGYDSELVWFSSNESVAYVDSGYVFGVGEGSAKITAAYGGGYAYCNVYVSDGGTGPVDAPKLNLNYNSQTLKVGDSFQLTVTSVNPEGTTVSFTSGNTNIATIEQTSDMSVKVTAQAEGSTAITVVGSNNVTKVCQITVSNGSGPATDYDIAVDTDLNYTGSLKIGSPKNQRTFMEGLLSDFNKFTGSKISWTIMDFEEDNGTTGYQDASGMPAVFPYASDQTMTLSQFGALANVPNADIEWIIENMGQDAKKAATLNKVVGYPFAADNGLVMFYSKSAVGDNKAILETLPGILEYADDHDMEVNYSLNNGFYIAPALMSYSGGQPLYEVEPDGNTYVATSNFCCDAGIQAAMDLRNIINHPAIRNATDAPRNGVLVTITDSSKVESFKKTLGNDYAVAPLPYIDTAKTARLGSFLGYKFYGINLQLGKADLTKACSVAKFLCSEYAQYKRFTQYNVRPTLILEKVHAEFSSAVLAEPHIAALIKQSENNGVIPMKAVSSSLWSETMVTYTDLKKVAAGADRSVYESILKALDKSLSKGS